MDKAGLSNFDLDDLLKDTPSYLGTFSHDHVPSFKGNVPQSAIINYNDSDDLGSHWVACYKSPSKQYVEFFDSFGVYPSTRIQNKLRESNKPILYNSLPIQPKVSTKCGLYCYMYITMRERGLPPYDIINLFQPNNSTDNDRLLIDLLEDDLAIIQ